MSELVKASDLSLGDIRDDKVYTPKQIAHVLQVSPKQIAQAFRGGGLAGIELGPKTIRITGKAVREWLTSKKSPTSLANSDGQAESSPTDNGASTSSKKGKSVGDLALASL